MRERLLEEIVEHIGYHAPLQLRCTALEIWLRDEVVVSGPDPGDESQARIDRRLPFLLYRDGIRSIQVEKTATREDIAAFLDALAVCASGRSEHEDMVSLLWAVDLTGLSFEVAPIESSLTVHAQSDARQAEGNEDPFDDWDAPGVIADAAELWRVLSPHEDAALRAWRQGWEAERARPWAERTAAVLEAAHALDPGPEMAEALGRGIVGWLAEAVEHGRWAEALSAYERLPRHPQARQELEALLTTTLAGLDSEGIAEKLDESDADAQARFFALTVQVGRPALDLVVAVLAHATRPRLRAAATTALCYTCSEEPRMLARYLNDSRWQVVRNIVFALGHIGGDDIVDMLAVAAGHLDSRVRRAVVHALGQVSPRRRLPLLIAQLETTDTPHLTAVLAMLARSPDDSVADALLRVITALDFETRPPEARVAILGALGDVATDRAIPTLEAMLLKGGWFARRTPERSAAANTLARIGSAAAIDVLQAGLRSRAEAVRAACHEALQRRERAA